MTKKQSEFEKRIKNDKKELFNAIEKVVMHYVTCDTDIRKLSKICHTMCFKATDNKINRQNYAMLIQKQ